MFCGFCGIYYDGQSGIMMIVLECYYDKTKNFCRGFAAIENLYITLYRSDVSEHSDADEHVVV